MSKVIPKKPEYQIIKYNGKNQAAVTEFCQGYNPVFINNMLSADAGNGYKILCSTGEYIIKEPNIGLKVVTRDVFLRDYSVIN